MLGLGGLPFKVGFHLHFFLLFVVCPSLTSALLLLTGLLFPEDRVALLNIILPHAPLLCFVSFLLRLGRLSLGFDVHLLANLRVNLRTAIWLGSRLLADFLAAEVARSLKLLTVELILLHSP